MATVWQELTDRVGRIPRPPSSIQERVWRWLVPLVFIVVLVIPGYTYFVSNEAGRWLFGAGVEPSTRFFVLFRLFGLYALVFLWGQIMLGLFMGPLARLYGHSWVYFQRWQGIFALLLAIMHPLILYVAYYLYTQVFNPVQAVAWYAGALAGYAYLGMAALILMLVTVGSALLMRWPALQKRWRWVHLFNYVVFGLVLVHSYMLGSEANVWPMSFLYLIFTITFVGGLVYKLFYLARRGQSGLPSLDSLSLPS